MYRAHLGNRPGRAMHLMRYAVNMQGIQYKEYRSCRGSSSDVQGGRGQRAAHRACACVRFSVNRCSKICGG